MKTIFTPLKSLMFATLFGFGLTAYAQPANDHITDATDLALGPISFLDEMVAFTQATSSGDGGQQGCGTGVAGVYYKFTATQTGEITAGIEPFANPIVVFYSSPTPNAQTGEELNYVDQGTNPCENSNFSGILAEAGTTYYIFVKNDVDANVMINIENVFAIPSNDFLVNATNLNGLEDYFDPEVHMLMATFTNDFGQTGCDTGEVRAVWYKFTAEVEGQVVAGIGSTPAESAIIFYEAPDENVETGSELTWVDQASNPCAASALNSIIAEAGKTYYIMAGTLDPFADISINLSGILSIGDQEQMDFTFYPNPVVNELNVQSSHSIDAIHIYSLLGQKVMSLEVNETEKVISLASLSKGMYLVEVEIGTYKETFKIIKQ